MTQSSVLLVEDDKDLLEALTMTLQNASFEVDAVESSTMALQMLRTKHYHIVLSDIQLDKMSGIDLLKFIKKQDYQTSVVLMTAYGKIDDAVFAIKNGAIDYITKPFVANELITKLNKISQYHHHPQNNLICHDEVMKKLFEVAAQVAKTDASVLISGESGTGKEILARFIHDNSLRKNEPFIAINCAAIPDNMLEAMLFGYEKGAFTGAHQSTPGKLEQGNGGTILLDEISEMPLALQAKILRVIQEKEVERLGGNKIIKLDARFISTTNRALAKEVELGHFRKDLYFRLNVFPMYIAALRDRKADIIPLSNYFIKKYASQPDMMLSEQAIEKLLNYAWHGNIRELQNVMQRSVILAKNNLIEPDIILFEVSHTQPAVHAFADDTLENKMVDKENALILQVLKECDGHREQSAHKLGISTRTLRYKISRMKKMGIQV
ncbi:sigma 54-interacting transcriptional regulator [Candidatus Berkiella aquae]|uniref:Sigma-54 dependent transcriptional regulator n=1 Tax=Candidatus Berkiella aquae TaxID=295108 RepID=A0A0Q9YNK5_9GAMM|nr:sigma-54 dependent transcriptional regulator [Candidatus Berkiella aquae]MCS5711428.1 sigma-54 dependent transcriptional regulator [Candidatus Berkiella aquae]